MTKKQRVAQFRIDSVQRTDQGALKVKANLTKTGVFDYQLPDGTTLREYRAPEEVFRQEALDSLHGAPVTLLHPGEFVTTGNWNLLAVGNVINVEVNEPYVTGTMLIHDSRIIEKVESGEIKEVSCGYTADILPAPAGVEHYDAAQTGISYNHAAIGPTQWGRLGSDVAIRLDASHQVILDDFMSKEIEATKPEASEGAEETEIETAEAIEDSAPEEGTEDFDLAVAFTKLQDSFSELKQLFLDSKEAAEPSEPEEVVEDDLEARVDSRIKLLDSVRDSYRVLCPGSEPTGTNVQELCTLALQTVEADVEGKDETVLVSMIHAAAKAKASVPVTDSVDAEKPRKSFAQRLLDNKHSAETREKSFAERLVDSVN